MTVKNEAKVMTGLNQMAKGEDQKVTPYSVLAQALMGDLKGAAEKAKELPPPKTPVKKPKK